MPQSATTKADAARDLIQRGFDIFPIRAGAKSPPLVKGFPELSRRCAEFVDAWWGGDKADRNIGIHCRDLLVLDVDIAKGGFDSLLQLDLEHGLPDTLEFATPSGGRHLVYSAPGGVKNSVGRLGPGLDVRSTGGFIVAPGSEVEAGAYALFADRPVAPAPEWLLSLAQRPSDRPEPILDTNVSVDQAHAVERARDWLAQAEPAVEGQGGDQRTYTVICRVRDFGVDADHCAEALEDWNARCEPPWDPDELQRKIENAYRYAENPPGVNSAEAMFDVVQPASSFANSEQDEEMYGPDDVSLDSVLTTDYLVKGWLDRSSHGLLFGHWGAGKTFIALHLALHIACDQPWFDHRVRQGGVLYFGYEGAKSMRRRVYALRQEFPDWDMSQFKLRPLRWPLAKRNATGKLAGQEKLERALKVFKDQTGDYPALIIIDPLRNALGGSDSDPDLTEPYLAYMKKISKATGCAVLTVHHPGHGDADRGRGDSGIEAAMDTVIKVDKDGGRIETRKQRDDPASALHYHLKTVEVGEDADGDKRTTCVVEPVDPNALDPSLTDEQQRVFDRLREQVGEHGLVTKTIFRGAAEHLPTTVRAEIFNVLLRKQFLSPEGKQWRIGAGAAEMFS